MRIFVPFTNLTSETYLAVPQAILIPLKDKRHGYGKYFWDRWQEREPFINVEHDVAPSQEILTELWECEHTLCVTRYLEGEGPSYLGCVKISRNFILNTPGLFDSYPIWNQCDQVIARAAMHMRHEHGVVRHVK